MDMDAIVAGQQDAAQEDSLWHRAKDYEPQAAVHLQPLLVLGSHTA